ncbi:Integrator complex subunit 2 [Coemansia sp. RSA 988]|nr:Integrator complex subunit 2 [Coemansia sp. RSA 988]
MVSKADIHDFVDGSIRRQIRLVLVQIYELFDRTPRIYKVLENKRSLENSPSAQSQLDRKLNTLWAELKTRCSLLIVAKDNMQQVADRPQHMGLHGSNNSSSGSDSNGGNSSVQSRVEAIMKKIANNCNILWEQFEISIRGLVFVDSGRKTVEAMLRRGDSQNSREISRRALQVLLEAYIVQPDLYKAQIRDMVDNIAEGSKDDAQLVVSELKGRLVLPGVMFRTLATGMQQDGGVDDTVGLLSEIFRGGAATWIGKRANGARPRYAAAGDTIRAAVYRRFFEMKRQERQRNVAVFTRGVAGLIGYLQLDVEETDYKFLAAASEAAADGQSATVCVALLVELAVFASDNTAQYILDAFIKMSTTAADSEIDRILVAFKVEDIKEASRLMTDVLTMDFGFPNERLFSLREKIEQSGEGFFSDGAIARRLAARRVEEVAKCGGKGLQYIDAVQLGLKHGMFEASGVNVGPWVGSLVSTASSAVANEMGGLIKAYVAAVFRSAAITPIPEEFLWQTFTARRIGVVTGTQAPPAQVLGLLYILHYNARVLAQGSGDSGVAAAPGKRMAEGIIDSPPIQSSALGSASRSGSTGAEKLALDGSNGSFRRGEYSDQLVDSVPVSWILQSVRRSGQYQRIWPELVAMATAQHPDQLEVESELQREEAEDDRWGGGLGVGRCLSDLEVSNPPSCLSALGCVDSPSGPDGLSPHVALRLQQAVEAYTQLPVAARMATCGQFAEKVCRAGVAEAGSPEVTAAMRRGWFAAHALDAHAVAAATANAWRGSGRARMTAQDVWLDPLVLLRSDARVLQSAALTDVLLTALAAALAQSRTALQRVFAQRRNGGVLQGAHVQALAQLQEAAAVQLAIEAAAHAPSDVQRLLFAFVHSRFLAQRGVQKLVHFQAYDADAIAAMVRYVPSMHACAEFVPELLMQAPPALQAFAARLAAAVVAQYPVPANEAMASEVVLPHAQTTLLHATQPVVQPTVCAAMLDAVVAVATAFPSACADCRLLVAAARDAARTRPASSAWLVSNCDAALASLGGAPEVTGRRPQQTSSSPHQIQQQHQQLNAQHQQSNTQHQQSNTQQQQSNAQPQRPNAQPQRPNAQPQRPNAQPQPSNTQHQRPNTQHQQPHPPPRLGAVPKRPHSAVAENPPCHTPSPLALGQHDVNADSAALPGLSLHPPRPPSRAVGLPPTPPVSSPAPTAFFKKRPRHRSRGPPRDAPGRLPRRTKSTSADRP